MNGGLVTLGVAVDAVLVVLVLKHLGQEDLEPVLNDLLPLLVVLALLGRHLVQVCDPGVRTIEPTCSSVRRRRGFSSLLLELLSLTHLTRLQVHSIKTGRLVKSAPVPEKG